MSQRIVVESDDGATPDQWGLFSDYLERAGWVRPGHAMEWVNERWAPGFPPQVAIVRMAMDAAGMQRVPAWHTGRSITPMMRRALRQDSEP